MVAMSAHLFDFCKKKIALNNEIIFLNFKDSGFESLLIIACLIFSAQLEDKFLIYHISNYSLNTFLNILFKLKRI